LTNAGVSRYEPCVGRKTMQGAILHSFATSSLAFSFLSFLSPMRRKSRRCFSCTARSAWSNDC
jgi:hypothetical protein